MGLLGDSVGGVDDVDGGDDGDGDDGNDGDGGGGGDGDDLDDMGIRSPRIREISWGPWVTLKILVIKIVFWCQYHR